MFVRLYRIADGLIQTNYFREVKLYADMPLLPELWRLMRSTLPLSQLLRGCLVLVVPGVRHPGRPSRARLPAALPGPGLAAARPVRRRRGARAGIQPLWPAKGEAVKVRHGLFVRQRGAAGVSRSATPSGSPLPAVKSAEIRTPRIGCGGPTNLGRFSGADFLLFLVESYGSAVFRQRSMTGTGCPAFEEFTRSVSERGYHIASKLMNSITYGGGSWYAHTTLRTGVRCATRWSSPDVTPQPAAPDDGPVLEAGRLPHDPGPAGHGPGFSRRPGRRLRPPLLRLPHGLRRAHLRIRLDARPVRDTRRSRQGGGEGQGSLFIEYGLVSTHAPWTPVPIAIEDWSKLERGRIFKTNTGVRFPVSWTDMEDGAVAYSYSLCYDFDVLRRYISERLDRRLHPDHGRPPAARGHHFRRSLLGGPDPRPQQRSRPDRRLRTAGYTPGMVPAEPGGPIAGMEAFMTEFLTMLSGAAPRKDPATALKSGRGQP